MERPRALLDNAGSGSDALTVLDILKSRLPNNISEFLTKFEQFGSLKVAENNEILLIVKNGGTEETIGKIVNSDLIPSKQLTQGTVIAEVNGQQLLKNGESYGFKAVANAVGKLFKVDDLLVLKKADLPDFVRNNLDDLLKPENRTIIWELTEEANGQFTRGNLIEEIFNQWGSKYKNHQNLNEIITNYKTLDFDGILNNVNEVVSLKTYHPKLSTEKTLNAIINKIDSYASKLSTATLDANHVGKNRILDFIIKKGEWDNLLPQIRQEIIKIQNNYGNILIRLTEF